LREAITAKYAGNASAQCNLKDGGVIYKEAIIHRDPKRGKHPGERTPEEVQATEPVIEAAVPSQESIPTGAAAVSIEESAPAVVEGTTPPAADAAATAAEAVPTQQDVDAVLKSAEAALGETAQVVPAP
jgi:hypothetical protein